jgi:hypothetical protein
MPRARHLFNLFYTGRSVVSSLRINMNRNTACIVGITVALLGVVALSLNGDILGEMRLRRVARILESSTALRKKYGSGCTVTLIDHGSQASIDFAMAYSISRFRIHGNGINKPLWVKWAGSKRDWSVVVYGFAEAPTSWNGAEEQLR